MKLVSHILAIRDQSTINNHSLKPNNHIASSAGNSLGKKNLKSDLGKGGGDFDVHKCHLI